MDIPRLLEALGSLAWPVLTAVLAWKAFPFFRNLLQARGFAVKVGGMELTVQEASDQLRQQLEDLQRKLSELRVQSQTAAVPSTPVAPPKEPAPRRLLWVDDVPANNAYEMARFREDGVEVVEATSTDEALGTLIGRHTPVRVVISDMGRREGGSYRPNAGLTLIQQLRAAGFTLPIFVYSSARGLEGVRNEVLAAGGNGATSSAVELFEMVREPLDLAG